MKERCLAVIALLLAGCGFDDPELAPDDEFSAEARLSADRVACQSLVFEAGRGGSGQTVAALATAELTGTQDSWSRYVEFSPNSRAVCRFQIPSGQRTAELRVVLNYRGPTRAEMVVRLEAYDLPAARWVLVTDNAAASDWRWTAQNTAFPASAARFIAADGTVLMRVLTGSQDASQLDLWALQLQLRPPDAGVVAVADAGVIAAADAGVARPDAGAAADAGSTTGTTTDGGWWKPKPGTSWQWQLSGALDLTVNATAFDVDLYETTQTQIDQLHAAGRKVICYFDTAYEPNRPDSALLAPYTGNPIVGWPGQYWLDFRAQAVRDVMAARLTLAKTKRCDAVEPDDIDAIDNNPGFPLTAADQLSFARFLSTQAHARGLSIGLKNNLAQIGELVSDFDFAVNEECFQYNECDQLKPFITASKAVFHTEYTSGSLATKGAQICPQANALNFDTLIKHLDLDAARFACR